MGATYSYPVGGFHALNIHAASMGGGIAMMIGLGLVVGFAIYCYRKSGRFTECRYNMFCHITLGN